MDGCDDCCQRTLHRTCPRSRLGDPPDRACRPDRHGHVQHYGMPDATTLRGPCPPANFRRSTRLRSRTGGHHPRQRLVLLRRFTVRRPPGRCRPLRGRRSAGPAARSPHRPCLDAPRGLRGVRLADSARSRSRPRRPALACRPATGRAGPGAPGACARTARYPRRLLIAHCPARRGPGSAVPPSTPYIAHFTPRPQARAEALNGVRTT